MPVFLMHWHALWGFLKHVEFLHVLCDNTFAVPHLKFDGVPWNIGCGLGSC